MSRKQMLRFKGARAPMQPRNTSGIDVSCKGKISWWSMQRAIDHANEINETRLIGERPVRAYPCRVNPKEFHVGRIKKSPSI